MTRAVLLVSVYISLEDLRRVRCVCGGLFFVKKKKKYSPRPLSYFCYRYTTGTRSFVYLKKYETDIYIYQNIMIIYGYLYP